MGILDMFKQQPAQQPATTPVAPVDQQVPAGNLQDPAAVAANSSVASNPAPAPASGSAQLSTTNPDSPMANYEKLWETKPNEQQDNQNPAAMNIDPAKLQEIVSKQNFANSLSPETLTAIAAGGEGAQAALATALNQVAQQSFQQAILVGNKLNEKQIQAAIAAEVSKLPQAMRNYNVTDYMQSSNPMLKNPAIAPVADAVKTQLMQQNPNASQQEIANMTMQYLTAMGQALTPPAPIPAALKEDDWSTFLEQ